MNEIEELIKAINSNIFKNPSDSPKEEYAPTSDFKHGYNQACRMIIRHLKVLQSKYGPVVVPDYMKEFLDFCIKNKQDGIDAYNGLFFICSSWPKEKILEWSFADPYRFINCFQYGCTVAKEPCWFVEIGSMYLKEPLGDTSDYTVKMTWNREYAYPFDSWNVAREHTSKLGGKIVPVEEEAE